jgi:ketosteroid isomerase-like protein
MAQDNLAIVLAMYDAFDRGDFVSASEPIHPDIEVETGGLIPDVASTLRGASTMGDMLAGFWGNFEKRPRSMVRHSQRVGEDKVLAVVRHQARGRTSGVSIDQDVGHLWTMRDGKAVRWQMFLDPKDAFEAAGLGPG